MRSLENDARCENKVAEVHAFRREFQKTLIYTKVFQTPA